VTTLQKLAAIVPLLITLLGWVSDSYLNMKKLDMAAARQAGDLKVMTDLATLASKPCN